MIVEIQIIFPLIVPDFLSSSTLSLLDERKANSIPEKTQKKEVK